MFIESLQIQGIILATVVHAKKKKMTPFSQAISRLVRVIEYVKQELCNGNNYVIENTTIKAKTVHEQFCKAYGEENLGFGVSRMKQQEWVEMAS